MTTPGSAHRPLIRTFLMGPALALALVLAACGQNADLDTDGPGRPDASGSRDPGARATERFLNATWPRGAPGTVLTARGGDLVTCWERGPAGRAEKARAGCGTVYDISSMTKQFTAAAILKLQMEGRLRVTDRVGRFLGGMPADKRRITLHQLLTHTSGLPEQLGDDYDPVSRKELLDGALAARLRFGPGDRFAYSNLGYSVLAAVVEKASGMGYEEYLADRLFTPAGMRHTGYVLPQWPRGRIAVEYDRAGEPQGTPLEHPWAADGPYWNLRGNGGMLSTARDMLRWHRALRGEEILDRRARAQLFRPRVREEGSALRYGYGWDLLDRGGSRIATHDGGNNWSIGRVARTVDGGVLVFWISNHAYGAGKWNLERLDRKLTLGLLARLRDGGR